MSPASAMVGRSGKSLWRVSPGGGQRPDGAGPDIAHGSRDGAEDHGDVPAEKVVHGGTQPAKRHMGQLDAGHAGKQLGGQMGRAAGAAAAEGELAGLFLGERDQLGNGVRRHVLVDDQNDRSSRRYRRSGRNPCAGRSRHWDTATAPCPWCRCWRCRACSHPARCCASCLGGERAAGAAAVLRHDLLAEHGAHAVGHDAAERVVAAADRGRDDKHDRADRIILRLRQAGRRPASASASSKTLMRLPPFCRRSARAWHDASNFPGGAKLRGVC